MKARHPANSRPTICIVMWILAMSAGDLARGQATHIDFDDGDLGQPVDTTYEQSGVKFINADFFLNNPNPDANGTIGIGSVAANNRPKQTTPIIAIFSSPQTVVSIDGWDVEDNAIRMDAYDAETGGTLVDFHEVHPPSRTIFNGTLTVAASNIRRIEIYQPVSPGSRDGFLLDDLRFQGANEPPIADASATQVTIIAGNNRTAEVLLDGSASTDPDGDPLTYLWFVDGGIDPVADEEFAEIELAVGEHTVHLIVSDGSESDEDVVFVKILPPGEASDQLCQQIQEGNLYKGISKSLCAKLKAASRSFNRGKFDTGINQLRAFQNEVNAQEGRKIDLELTGELISASQAIINAVTG